MTSILVALGIAFVGFVIHCVVKQPSIQDEDGLEEVNITFVEENGRWYSYHGNEFLCWADDKEELAEKTLEMYNNVVDFKRVDDE